MDNANTGLGGKFVSAQPLQPQTQSASPSKKYLYDIDANALDSPALLLRAVGENRKVLEIGCASGTQSRAMKERGCRITGIEIDADAASEAAAYCERVIVADLESLDFDEALGTEQFEVVTIADVLEHLRRPQHVLTEIRRFLQSDGIVVASIPNVVHAGLILDMAKGQFDYRPYGLLDDTHIRFFTLKSIASLFEACGLEIVQVDRALKPVENTEFLCDRPLSPSELSVLEFIREHNPEHQTYQFVISAKFRRLEGVRRQEIELGDRVKELELGRTAYLARIRKLESQIAWMEKRPLRVVVASLRRALALGR